MGSTPSYGAYALMGAGTAGLAYLMYQGRSISHQRTTAALYGQD